MHTCPELPYVMDQLIRKDFSTRASLWIWNTYVQSAETFMDTACFKADAARIYCVNLPTEFVGGGVGGWLGLMNFTFL